MLNFKASGAALQGTSSENTNMESCTVHKSARFNAGATCYIWELLLSYRSDNKHPYACKFTFKIMVNKTL